MTKKDFELIARVLRDSGLDDHQKHSLAQRFAWELYETNPRFDADKFVRAALQEN